FPSSARAASSAPVVVTVGNAATDTKSIPSGTPTKPATLTTHILASACAVCAKTLSPLVKVFTPGPAFSTVPETSQPRIAGKDTGKYSLTAPDLIFTSSGYESSRPCTEWGW